MTATPDNRATLRRRIRQRRASLSPHARRAADSRICATLQGLPEFGAARHIAFYLANDGEADPAQAMHTALARGKQVYLPVLVPLRRPRLLFARYTPDTPMALNRYGIAEPDIPHHCLLPPRALDLVITPLVAFDAALNRLGMGGGYYDNTFSFLRRRQAWRHPRLVGIAYQCQQTRRLAAAPWDVPLDAIVTEQGLRRRQA